MYFNRANAHGHLEDDEIAIEDYDEAIRLIPQPDACTARGRSSGNLSRFHRAVVEYDKVIRMDHEYVMAYANRAVAHTALGHNDQARKDKCQAVKLGVDAPISRRGNRAG